MISSLGAVPYEGDEWGVDVGVGGAQKALIGTPGLAFVSVSEPGVGGHQDREEPAVLLRLGDLQGVRFDWTTPRARTRRRSLWWPGCAAAVRLYLDEGYEAVLERHRVLSEATKEGVRALGLDLDGEDPERAWAVTAVRAPEGIDGNELVPRVRSKHRIILAPGQGPLKGKVFRIGHLGYYDRFDIIRCLAALELTLEEMGYPVKRGAAVAAAEAIFAANP